MNPTDLLPACVALVLALCTSQLLNRRSPRDVEATRFRTIDGLRGYLAFGVFLHHSVIWGPFRQNAAWARPPSNVYVNLGAASVALFFMITAFLFARRVLQGRHKPIDWPLLYVSRWLRLAPAYLVATTIAFGVVGIESHWQMRVSGAEFWREILDWLSFTFTGMPDVNGVTGTRFVLAAAVWSLPYEWLFYMALPLLALLVGVRPALWTFIAPLIGAGLIASETWVPGVKFLQAFAVGIVAAVLVDAAPLKRFARTPWASVVVLACLVWDFVACNDAFTTRAIVALGLAFLLIAAGADLFGVLGSRLSVRFGDPTYSMYLLHGALLYGAFRFVLSPATAAALSPTQHWLLVWGMTPVLVVISAASYRFIERPMMDASRPLMARIRLRG